MIATLDQIGDNNRASIYYDASLFQVTPSFGLTPLIVNYFKLNPEFTIWRSIHRGK